MLCSESLAWSAFSNTGKENMYSYNLLGDCVPALPASEPQNACFSQTVLFWKQLEPSNGEQGHPQVFYLFKEP